MVFHATVSLFKYEMFTRKSFHIYIESRRDIAETGRTRKKKYEWMNMMMEKVFFFWHAALTTWKFNAKMCFTFLSCAQQQSVRKEHVWQFSSNERKKEKMCRCRTCEWKHCIFCECLSTQSGACHCVHCTHAKIGNLFIHICWRHKFSNADMSLTINSMLNTDNSTIIRMKTIFVFDS